MAQASGTFKQISYKAETTYGVKPAATAAQLLRRISSSLDLEKDTYKSNEIRPDFQVADFRHGRRRVAGTVSGELSAKTYADFIAAILKRDFAAGASSTGLSITIAGSAGAWTITRATGSWLTDGVKIGDVVRATAGAFNVANLNKNIFLTNVTALVLTGVVLNASVLVAEGPIASATVSVFGKKTLVPQTGHTDRSFAIEHWYPEAPSSEVFTGCKPSKVSIGLPSTGMATCAIDFVGKDGEATGSQYFTSPTALTTTGTMAAVNGVLRVAGTVVANVTGLSIDINASQAGEPTVGSNTIASQAPGPVMVSGQLTVAFDNAVMRDAFYNETEVSLIAVFTADNGAASDFIGFNLPRIKLGGNDKDDGAKSIVQTIPYQALLNIAGGAALSTDLTTIAIQDSAA